MDKFTLTSCTFMDTFISISSAVPSSIDKDRFKLNSWVHI